jgi:hypothetical protein
MHSDTTQFLDLLRQGAEDYLCHIWVLSTKRSYWFTDHTKLPWHVIGDRDVYVGGGLTKRGEQRSMNERLRYDTTDGIVGLWADIDVAGLAHKKDNLPSQEQARAILHSLPFLPTVTIKSGHGYQCWWLFGSPWLFADEDERQLAQRTLQGWNRLIQSEAARHNAIVDSVFDLARIMRLPGTENHKIPEQPKPVEIYDTSSKRYIQEDFIPYAVEEGPFVAPGSMGSVTLGEFGPDIAPPAEKFSTLLLNDPDFAATFHHTRRMKDTSLSAWDMALANIAVKAGWEDDEVAGLLVMHRKRYGDTSDKSTRRSYLTQTIAKARAGNVEEMASEQLAHATGTTEILEQFSKFIGVKVNGVTRFTGREPHYRIDITDDHGVDHSVNLGGADSFVNMTPFRKRVFESASVLIEPKRPKQWAVSVTKLMQTAVVVDTGEDISERGQFLGLVQEYLWQRPPASDINEAVVAQSPVLVDDHLHIFVRPFTHWLRDDKKEKMAPSEVAAMMSFFKCETVVLHYTSHITGNQTSTTARRLPTDLFPPADFIQ